jgi:hypothetical protein
MPDTPFLAIGAAELDGAPAIRAGDHVACPHCGSPHPVTYGTKTDGTPSDLLAAYTCSQTGSTYLCGVAGSALPGVNLLRPAADGDDGQPVDEPPVVAAVTQAGATVTVPSALLRRLATCAHDVGFTIGGANGADLSRAARDAFALLRPATGGNATP